MTTADMTDIPDNDTSAHVDWQDKLGTPVPGANVATAWTAEDETGGASAAVTVTAGADNDEDATVHFNVGQGMFKLVATTTGQDGTAVRAESGMYNITPGAPAVGVISLNPV